MAKMFSWRMAAALDDGAPIVLLVEIEHPDGTARFWSGIGTLDWNDEDWTGAGVLGSVTPIQHGVELKIQEIQFALAGVDTDAVAGLSDNVRNLAGRVWIACLDTSGKIIADPFQILDAQLDYQTLQAGEDGTVSIAITARSGFYTLQRAANDVWSAEDQKTRFPTDTGLHMISELVNQTIQWTPS